MTSERPPNDCDKVKTKLSSMLISLPLVLLLVPFEEV